MSLILDALRKSERARQQSLTGQVSSAGPTLERSRLPIPWVTLIGAILLLNAIVLGFLLWRADESAQPKSAPTGVIPAHAALAAKPTIRPLAAEAEASEPDSHIVTAQQPTATNAIPSVADATAAASVAQSAGIEAPPLDTMPMTFQQALPALHLDVHGYAANPADRFVIINMHRYVAGDTLKQGLQVIAITPQGVILEYQGTRFLLPRN
ncbi:MAG: general secretion pathway protein GspB [Gammaproteobacteria bacterium]